MAGLLEDLPNLLVLRSFSKGAEQNFVSQSAASQAVQQLAPVQHRVGLLTHDVAVPLGVGVPLDRALLLTGITTTIVRESRARGRLATRPIDWLLMLVALYVVCSSILAGTIDEGDARFALLDRFGLQAIGQVDLHRRVHRNQRLLSLARMAFTVTAVVLQRLEQRDLLRRRYELSPVLERHGMRLRLDVLRDENRRLGMRLRRPAGRLPAPWRLPATAADLRDTLVDLRRWLAGGGRVRA